MIILKKVYFDNNATTIVSERVLSSMMPFLRENYGNPSSIYPFGIKVKNAIENARLSVSKLIDSELNEVIFTSGGSESNSTAILSYANLFPLKKHIICSPVEHYSIMALMDSLATRGYEIDYLPIDKCGNIDFSVIPQMIKEDTLLIVVMLANNETGVIHDISRIRDVIPRTRKVFIHTDAVQAIGKIPVSVKTLNVDSLSISGHKFHAPKGVGALFYSKSLPFNPLVVGHQEKGRRGGTENVSSIIGMGCAADDIRQKFQERVEKMNALHQYFEERIKEIDSVYIIAEKGNRICNTTNFSIFNVDGTKLMLMLSQKGICVSTGSACNSEEQSASHVLTAMKIRKEYLKSIRVSFNEFNTFSEIDYFIDTLKKLLKRRDDYVSVN